jgi:hypothetical protein
MRAGNRSPSSRFAGRTLAAGFVFAVAVAAAVPARAQLCGDPDGSGTIDVVDAANIQRAAVGLPSACTAAPAACDLDGSGMIDVLDAANALRAAVGLPAALACVSELSEFLAGMQIVDGPEGVLGLGAAPIPGPDAPETIQSLDGQANVIAGGINTLFVGYDTGMEGAQLTGDPELLVAIAPQAQPQTPIDGFFALPLASPSGQVRVRIRYAQSLPPEPFLLKLATRRGGVVGRYAMLLQASGGPPPFEIEDLVDRIVPFLSVGLGSLATLPSTLTCFGGSIDVDSEGNETALFFEECGAGGVAIDGEVILVGSLVSVAASTTQRVTDLVLDLSSEGGIFVMNVVGGIVLNGSVEVEGDLSEDASTVFFLNLSGLRISESGVLESGNAVLDLSGVDPLDVEGTDFAGVTRIEIAFNGTKAALVTVTRTDGGTQSFVIDLP